MILIGFSSVDNFLKLLKPSTFCLQESRAPLNICMGSDLKHVSKHNIEASEGDWEQKRLKHVIEQMFLLSYTCVGRKIGVVCYHFNTTICI